MRVSNFRTVYDQAHEVPDDIVRNLDNWNTISDTQVDRTKNFFRSTFNIQFDKMYIVFKPCDPGCMLISFLNGGTRDATRFIGLRQLHTRPGSETNDKPWKAALFAGDSVNLLATRTVNFDGPARNLHVVPLEPRPSNLMR